MAHAKKTIYHRPKRYSFFHHPILYIFIGALIGVGISLFISYEAKHKMNERQLPETSRNEMRKIPPDVKKAMVNHELSASNSANLPTASISGTIRVPILLYHYVEYVANKNDKMRQELTISPAVFDSQIATLKDAGYTFLTAKELGEMLDGKKQLPQKPILLTFDDGHWDIDTVILPILKKYNVKATAYVIPGFIGGSDFLTSTQLQDVIASGLIEIGAHTVHHLSLKGRPLTTVQYEVTQSKQLLEKQYHLQIVSFAYPYGTFDLQAVNVVKNAGFTTAVSTIPGIMQDQQNRFFLYRIRPGARTGQYLLNLLQQNSFHAY